MTQEYLNTILEYRDGELYWKKRLSIQITIGKKAGYTDDEGYVFVGIHNKVYSMHRIIWIMHYGIINKSQLIDHKDRNPSNNRIENLRLCDHSQNLANRPKQLNNTSGYKGVTIDNRTGYWAARIWHKNKSYSRGGFKTPEDAYQAYKILATYLNGEFANF